MPCRDDRDEPGWDRGYREGKGDLATMTAIACMLMRVVQNNDLADTLDYVGAGVSEDEVKRWWTQHLLEDDKRRKAEKAEKDRRAKVAKLKKKMRSTFTKDELKLLTQADPASAAWLGDDGI